MEEQELDLFENESEGTESTGLENQGSQLLSENLYSPEFEKSINGKERNDLVKMLYDSQKQIGKLSQELGDVRKNTLPLQTSELSKRDISSL